MKFGGLAGGYGIRPYGFNLSATLTPSFSIFHCQLSIKFPVFHVAGLNHRRFGIFHLPGYRFFFFSFFHIHPPVSLSMARQEKTIQKSKSTAAKMQRCQSLCNYTRYFLISSDASAGSSETVMVMFILFAWAKSAHQVMKASPVARSLPMVL